MNFLNMDKLMEQAVTIGLKLVYLAILVIICVLLIRISRHIIFKLINSRMKKSRFFDPRKAETLSSVSFSGVKYVLIFITGFTILTNLGIPVASLLTVAGVGSVAIGFGSQDLVKDVLAGFFILLEDQFGVGDIVEIEGKTGTVEAISIRTTKLRDADGTVYIIPNGSIGMVTNKCKEFINAIVDVDIDYGENMDRVLRVLNDEMERCEKKIQGLRNKPTVLGIINLGESAVTVRITAECEVKENYHVEREIKLCLLKRLEKEKITIPFPQRTVYIVNASTAEEKQEG